ncbi:MAG: LemA family protein [Deltaproteobacteria bacterium]|nr:LemA family protein [Deltaproteobacteria bacterium]MCK5514172.1 LemA family protein [Deltaproteobacteria bacterium]
MSKGAKIALIILGIIVLFGIIIFSSIKGTYNSLVTLDEGVKAAWAQVENQLQRRYDLIPNYVETVKGYAKHEKELFVKVTEARSKVGGATNIPDKIKANNQLSGALSRLMLVVERYPELKANQNFIRLQDELAGTENRIAVERRRYNETVKILNIKVRSFPTNILAGMFGFEKAAFFEVPEAAKAVPKVEF